MTTLKLQAMRRLLLQIAASINGMVTLIEAELCERGVRVEREGRREWPA